MFMAVGQGSSNPPRMIVMRSGGEGEKRRARSAPGHRRQGRLLRLGRHQHQAIGPDGRDEDGQDRGLHGPRGHRDRGPAGPGHAAARRGPGRREHARPAFDPARRHRQGAQRQEGRYHEHRRRGTTDPRRRDGLCRAARGDPHGRCRDADRRRRAGPRPPRDRARSGHRRASTTTSRRPRDRAGERYLAAAARRRLRARHGQLVRRLPELQLGRGFAREERPVPARVRDRAVGPPRYRRDGLLPQGAAVPARGATGVSHATLVELALAGAGDGPG